MGRPGSLCEDINECTDGQHSCRYVSFQTTQFYSSSDKELCTNNEGSYTCTCKPGRSGTDCSDVDECYKGLHHCPINSLCKNTGKVITYNSIQNLLDGSFECECEPGYEGPPMLYCLNVDECALNDVCGQNSYCRDSPGSYRCFCKPGFVKNSEGKCEDQDECQLGIHSCSPGTDINFQL